MRKIALVLLFVSACARAAAPNDSSSASHAPDASPSASSAADSGAEDAASSTPDAAASARGASSGELGPWVMSADHPRSDKNCFESAGELLCPQQTCVESSGYAYCVGGATTAAHYSKLESGELGPWTRGVDYPVSVERPSCVVSADYMYCVGGELDVAQGAPNSSTAEVYYAQLSASGIGAWTATTSFPHPDVPRCMVASGYIYCLSLNPDPPNAPEAYYAALSSNGIGEWLSTTALPEKTWSRCSAIGDYAYCIGDGGCPPYHPASDCYSHSYYAPLTASGIGSWKPTTELPTAVSAISATAGSYIYYLSTPVFFAHVSAEGIGPWQTTTNYPNGSNPSSCFASADHLYCGTSAANGSYVAPLGTPNPHALKLEEPPPFPRSEYLVPAWLRGGSVSVDSLGVFAGAPGYQRNIDDVVTFHCAGQEKTVEGCKTTVVSPEHTAYNYDLTVWYPCTERVAADQNCCFLPKVGYPQPFYAWCSGVGEDTFIISHRLDMLPSQ